MNFTELQIDINRFEQTINTMHDVILQAIEKVMKNEEI